jgi:hypothetical protein
MQRYLSQENASNGCYCDYKPYLTERGNVITTSILNYAMNQLMFKSKTKGPKSWNKPLLMGLKTL